MIATTPSMSSIVIDGEEWVKKSKVDTLLIRAEHDLRNKDQANRLLLERMRDLEEKRCACINCPIRQQ